VILWLIPILSSFWVLPISCTAYSSVDAYHTLTLAIIAYTRFVAKQCTYKLSLNCWTNMYNTVKRIKQTAQNIGLKQRQAKILCTHNESLTRLCLHTPHQWIHISYNAKEDSIPTVERQLWRSQINTQQEECQLTETMTVKDQVHLCTTANLL